MLPAIASIGARSFRRPSFCSNSSGSLQQLEERSRKTSKALKPSKEYHILIYIYIYILFIYVYNCLLRYEFASPTVIDAYSLRGSSTSVEWVLQGAVSFSLVAVHDLQEVWMDPSGSTWTSRRTWGRSGRASRSCASTSIKSSRVD